MNRPVKANYEHFHPFLSILATIWFSLASHIELSQHYTNFSNLSIYSIVCLFVVCFLLSPSTFFVFYFFFLHLNPTINVCLSFVRNIRQKIAIKNSNPTRWVTDLKRKKSKYEWERKINKIYFNKIIRTITSLYIAVRDMICVRESFCIQS
jgi:predicted membrane-bound dolichyl-phosphate-mannose-protein mannosyltransferase